MSDLLVPNRPAIYATSANVVGTALQLGFPNQGDEANRRCPVNLRAIAWPEGKRIDLKWTNPSDVTRIVIKRSRVSHSAFITDAHDVVYNGGPVEHFIDGRIVPETVGHPSRVQQPSPLEVGVPNTGVDLEEDVVYYYTVYMTAASSPVGLHDFGLEAREDCQVHQVSMIDYLRSTTRGDGSSISGRGEYVYGMQTQRTRDKDQENAEAQGRSTGWYQNVCRWWQGSLSLHRGTIRVLERTGDPDACASGLMGLAVGQSTILRAKVRALGIRPPRRALDVSILRRIVSEWGRLRKVKGTCPALVDWVKVLTTWDSTCSSVDGDRCNPFFLKTWDGVSVNDRFSYPASFVSVTAGQLILPGAGLTPGKYVNGLVIGPMWDQFAISDNTDSVVLLDDSTAVLRAEDLLSISAVSAVGGTVYDLTVTRTAGGPSVLNDNEYNGLELLDSANTLCDVTDVTSGAPSTVRVDSPSGAPIAGNAAVARSYILGANFAARDPQFLVALRTGCPTFTYDPLKDVSLKGADFDPHDVTYNGGSLFGIPFKPSDMVLTVASGVAHAVGQATIVTGFVLTDSAANFGTASSLRGYYLNPNRNQTVLFKIVDNTSTTLTVEAPHAGVDLETVSRAGTDYFVLDLPSARKYEIIQDHAYDMVPHPSRLFVYFDE